MTANDQMILKQESMKAFQEVLIVGRDAAKNLAEAREAQDPVAEAMAMTFGIAAMQDAIRDNPASLSVIMRNAGHKWGFKTDRDAWDGSGTAYKPDVVVPCLCEAVVNGLRPVGNEFNIISSSQYTTKEGWGGLLDRLPGVTEVDSRPGAIVDFEEREFQTKKGETKKKITASVSATADCKVWGQFVQVRAWKTEDADERLQLSSIAEEIDEALDQLKGKADARILERLYQKVKSVAMAVPQAAEVAPVAAPVISHVEATAKDSIVTEYAESKRDEMIRLKVCCKNDKEKSWRMLKGDDSARDTFKEVWEAYRDSGTLEALDGKEKAYQASTSSFSADVKRTLNEYRRLREYEIQHGEIEVPS